MSCAIVSSHLGGAIEHPGGALCAAENPWLESLYLVGEGRHISRTANGQLHPCRHIYSNKRVALDVVGVVNDVKG